MPDLYLIGGGWDEVSFPQTFGRFVQAGTKDGHCTILLVLAINDVAARNEITEDFTQMFHALGNVKTEPFFLSTTQNITCDILHAIAPSCIFVGGGLTPRYQEFLGNNRDFIEYILNNNLPYGGFSAGSAIAAQQSIVGGWKITASGHDIPILDADFSEGLDNIEIREGLGFLPYPLDVHGSQWGTITRVIHAVDHNLIEHGLVLDESTMIEYKNDTMTVFGMGHVYFIQKNGSTLELSLYKDGDIIR